MRGRISSGLEGRRITCCNFHSTSYLQLRVGISRMAIHHPPEWDACDSPLACQDVFRSSRLPIFDTSSANSRTCHCACLVHPKVINARWTLTCLKEFGSEHLSPEGNNLSPSHVQFGGYEYVYFGFDNNAHAHIPECVHIHAKICTRTHTHTRA